MKEHILIAGRSGSGKTNLTFVLVEGIFSHVYVEAFETILMIEKVFGQELREHAIRISKERYALRQEALNEGFRSAGDMVRK